ncbi:hypothetical protein NDU88_004119 [Pleurodeles waltl]|uniref:Uncharacterized protein n=1 Tax=Pleurodeles waltl TaxID=8319 RepID=A0AAV7UI92_PLEWA|nr:hypothetical protein NDU88_004119 [Pleurodeles waltl]
MQRKRRPEEAERTRATMRSRKRPLKKKKGEVTPRALACREERRRRGAGCRERSEARSKWKKRAHSAANKQ